jgi:hypothetical protein
MSRTERCNGPLCAGLRPGLQGGGAAKILTLNIQDM